MAKGSWRPCRCMLAIRASMRSPLRPRGRSLNHAALLSLRGASLSHHVDVVGKDRRAVLLQLQPSHFSSFPKHFRTSGLDGQKYAGSGRRTEGSPLAKQPRLHGRKHSMLTTIQQLHRASALQNRRSFVQVILGMFDQLDRLGLKHFSLRHFFAKLLFKLVCDLVNALMLWPKV
jgi:hypothetical protein